MVGQFSFLDVSQRNHTNPMFLTFNCYFKMAKCQLTSVLPQADNSPFSIDLLSGFGLYTMPEEVNGIDHYTVYVKGYEPLF